MADDKRNEAQQGADEAQQTTQQAPAARPKGPAILGSQDLPQAAQLKRPRGAMGKIMARDTRPAPMPQPMSRQNVQAFTPTPVMDRWSADAAGVRAVEMGDNVITMFGAIGEDYWSGEGVTAKGVTRQLRAIGGRDVEIHVNSPGGDMFEGIAIYNVLREHPYNVKIKVMGIAASAASIIAMAGNTVEIGTASFLMIHNCSVFAAGNRHDFQEVADFLKPFDLAMADLYAERTGLEAKQITAWMDAETYMSGKTAVERGFADALMAAAEVKVDEKAKAHDREVNEVRALELSLVTAGMSRTDARARIQKIKGTPGAAVDPVVTPGAVDAPKPDWSLLTAGLMTTLQSK